MDEQASKKPRGFAGMSKEQLSVMGRKGGIAAHKAGTAHKWTKETASEAGKKGAAAMHANQKQKMEGVNGDR